MANATMNCGIYELRSSSGNFYIGSSNNIHDRTRHHGRFLSNGKHNNPHLQHAFNKHGQLAMKTLLVCRPEDLIFYEQLLIDELKPSYNLQPIAGKPPSQKNNKTLHERLSRLLKGRKLPPEVRAKIEVAVWSKKRGKPSFMKGKHHSQESKTKMSEAKKGIPKSPETRANMARAQQTCKNKRRTGLKNSPAHNAALLASRIGSKHTPEAKAKMAAAVARWRANGGKATFSQETRAKISASMIGNKRGAKNKTTET